jgi:predicted amidohydrolase
MVPELAVSGYPPEDLLFHSGLRAQVARSIERLRIRVARDHLVAGYPEYAGDRIFNSAIVIRDGEVLANHRKACLPNYRVFDEKRYFTPGTLPTVLDLNGIRAGILVCEDVWEPEPAAQARGRRSSAAGHQCLALRGQQANPAGARRGPAACGRDGHSAAVRQSHRRPGRAGVRRQLLRHERAR